MKSHVAAACLLHVCSASFSVAKCGTGGIAARRCALPARKLLVHLARLVYVLLAAAAVSGSQQECV
jgi:hypothetical protein